MYYFGKYENVLTGDKQMIVMDLRIDNFFAFKNFHMNMSYPKKIVNSYIVGEYLKDRTNFRYKKVNIIMGGNATGKSSIGNMIMKTFNFIEKKELSHLTNVICDKSKKSSLTMDFIAKSYKLYRLQVEIQPKDDIEYMNSDIKVSVKFVDIEKNDNYEICSKKLSEMDDKMEANYVDELEKVESLSWLFTYASDNSGCSVCKYKKYPQILEYTLKALDCSIDKVEKISDVENSYVIRLQNQDIIIQDGKVIKDNILSSGTKAGIDIAFMVASIKEGGYSFYYCDEKFSYIHSDMEKEFLKVMINSLYDNDQLFFTTHNSDILDLSLPNHTFTFLKKDINNNEEPIKCIYASDYLKRNTDSIKNAVENDLFSTAPSVEYIYEIEEL